MLKFIPLFFLLASQAQARPYIELGLGVPLSPTTGYTPDSYGIASIGYEHNLDKQMSVDMGFVHRSLTGADLCNNANCAGDNAVEVKLRFEWK